MKTAYLVFWKNFNTNEQGYQWENDNETNISRKFATIEDADKNKPAGYTKFIYLAK